MKILVISDTHGNALAPLAFIDETEAGLLIHLGDETADARTLEPLIGIPMITIAGNCDHSDPAPRELIESIGGHRFLMTHGDRYGVKNGLERLAAQAAASGASVALFGHTHQPLIQKQDGVLLINPGTLMAGCDAKSYALLTVTPFTVSGEIIHLP